MLPIRPLGKAALGTVMALREDTTRDSEPSNGGNGAGG